MHIRQAYKGWSYIIQGWPHNKNEVKQGRQKYWPIMHELAVIFGMAMKGTRIIIPFILQGQILWQLHSNHMGIEKVRLLTRQLVYWVNVNADIGDTTKQCDKCLEYQQG